MPYDRKKNKKNQLLDGAMNYLNLTQIEEMEKIGEFLSPAGEQMG